MKQPVRPSRVAGASGRTAQAATTDRRGRTTNTAARPGRSTRPTPPARRSRRLLTLAGVFGLVGLCLLILAVAPESQAAHPWLAMAASFAPYGWLAWGVAVVLALVGARGRTRLLAAPLALGLAWHTGLIAPYLPAPAHKGTPPTSLTVLEQNLRFGEADVAQLAAVVDRYRPDVVVLTEATRATEKALKDRAWSRALPYRAGTVGDDNPATGAGDARGTLVLSRQPVGRPEMTDDTLFTNLAVSLKVAGTSVTLIAAHAANPGHGSSRWLGDGDALTRLALRHQDGPLVVAGDLNATAEHLTLRTLNAKAGLSDTASGQGWHPTYPADAWYPPLIQIDHVLVSRQFSTTGYRTIQVAGTDHLGLLVSLALS